MKSKPHEIQLLGQPKIFGVAFEASDDSASIALKHAAAEAKGNQIEILYHDLYDAITRHFKNDNDFEFVGKLDLPKWITPIPNADDIELLTAENFCSFINNGGALAIAQKVESFVTEELLPGLPVMIGVDHSTSGGVVAAISKYLGPENLTVLVLDQHFDGLTLDMRLNPQRLSEIKNRPFEKENDQMMDPSAYCCGNFWKHLIDQETVYPENLHFVGVADYPDSLPSDEWKVYRDNYRSFEEMGCGFFPLQNFTDTYQDKLAEFLNDRITTPYVYLSLDLDVGAYQSVHAARYMDRVGLDRQALDTVIDSIISDCVKKNTTIAGLDIMECNIHFLGIKIAEGSYDNTLSVATTFLESIIS